MIKNIKYIIVVFIVLFITASIKVFGFPWNFDMFKQKSIKPYEMPFSYPVGTVTINGQTNPEERSKVEIITSNQLGKNELDLKQGEELYTTFCAVCHGPHGDGDGPVIKKGFYPVNLKVQGVKNRTDGYIFAYIRYGGKVMMPSYRESVSANEAWQIVNYVRHLQSQSN